jgi:hypothetical protein
LGGERSIRSDETLTGQSISGSVFAVQAGENLLMTSGSSMQLKKSAADAGDSVAAL